MISSAQKELRVSNSVSIIASLASNNKNKSERDMNKELVNVVIIDEPFSYAELDILGIPLREYVKLNTADLDPIVASCKKEIDVTGSKYIALIYSHMPLITSSTILDIVNYCDENNIESLALGDGIIALSSLMGDINPTRAYNGDECISALTPDRLSDVYRELCLRNINKAISQGALILDKTAIYIDYDVVVEPGVIIHPMVTIKGKSILKSGAVIKSGSVIENSIIGSGTSVLASFVNDSRIGDNTTIGPCSLIRGNSEIGSNVRIGDFVEVKASKMGDGCKAAHLTYIGDADIGVSVNIGCGTVFANYNGKLKQKTIVGDYAFIGSNTNLVAPIRVGNNAYTAAGSTVTEDVPDNTLCIARSRQIIKELKKS